ncbi:hypothetical protein B0T10DRAFT_463259 [Thelonectria olida]|uniref:Uncharacterized protein n=1 Tax=Thelonectria olida TaxID=1576542 RepID=A0A9P8VWQ3_9HYPO|nr:hypothetical protein B0T10DRAFT_463259 [Thelonectria olida]
MENHAVTSISCDKSAILNRIFSKTKWKEEMASLGFTALFIGVHLERFDENGSVSDSAADMGNAPAYLALGLVTKECEVPLAEYPKGFPKRDLFFDCLKPWKWANEQQCDILIEESNIELNISEYYKTIFGATLLANPADSHRLTKERPDAAAEKYINRKHITYAISYGDEDPGQIELFYYNEDCLCIMIRVWGEYRLWQFIDTRR